MRQPQAKATPGDIDGRRPVTWGMQWPSSSRAVPGDLALVPAAWECRGQVESTDRSDGVGAGQEHLVVASRTATSARLMHAIEARAAAGGCRFTLLLPDAADREAANRTLNMALPLMRRASRSPVNGLVGGPDPFEAVQALSGKGASTRSSCRRCRNACRGGSDGTSSPASRGWAFR